MKIIMTTLPSKSTLNNQQKYDYVDSFETEISDPNNKITSSDVGKAFFSSAPKWVENLMNLRNKIAIIFGLKTDPKAGNKKQQLDNFKCEKGEQLGLFKVLDKTETEVILGENDKHLDFRVSLFLENASVNPQNKKIIISTAVVFNNWFGELYFLPVRPFHRLIVPKMLKGIIKELSENNKNKQISL